METKKTKYNSVYKTSKGKYFYIINQKQIDGTYKTIRSKRFDDVIECYKESLSIKCDNKKDVKQLIREKEVEPILIKKENKKISESIVSNYTINNAANDYLKDYEVTHKTTSVINYKSKIDNYIIKYFDNMTLNKVLEKETLEKYRLYMKNLNVKNSTKNYVCSLFKEIIKFARLENKISMENQNLVERMFKRFVNAEIEDDSQNDDNKFYTEQQLQQLLSAVDRPEYYLMFKFMFYSGCRIGELLGLQVKHVEKDSIRIGQQKLLLGGIGTPKNKNGYRNIYISSKLMEELKNFINENGLKNDDYIFNTSRSNIVRKLKYYADKANIFYLHPHGFRHSCCCYLVNKYIERNYPVDWKVIASHMGHSIAESMDTYSHLQKESVTRIKDLLDDESTTTNINSKA